MKFSKVFSFFLLFLPFYNLQSQVSEDWYLRNPVANGPLGIAAEDIFTNDLQARSSSPVIVAVIDSGVDVEHEDLQDNVWVNEDEIPGNGIDDDGNGYIDDINGWNFIGGPDGNVGADTYEVTRIYQKYDYKYRSAKPEKLTKKQRAEYDLYIKCKAEVEEKKAKAEKTLSRIIETENTLRSAMEAIMDAVGDQKVNLETLENIDASGDHSLIIGQNIIMDMIMKGEDVTDISEVSEYILKDIEEARQYYETKVHIAYNPDYDSRKIVGDNYADSSERYYGNNDVEGPDAFHGTHVAGIIGAVRDNGIGIDGVARDVRIMSVRTVPDGDERDKDVANAIRYAVDNGASIINMSFGKGYAWEKEIVDKAVKYAQKNDVLLVHAAGNSGQNNDIHANFPNDEYKKKGFFLCKKKKAKNWVEVGALSYNSGGNLVAPFSNYGQANVDIFAPGMAMYSTIPGNKYADAQGTSMAAPVVAGVAAILRSYFPALSAEQVKEILMDSVTPVEQDVLVPGTSDTYLPFSEISVSGGVVNASKAIELASKTKGRKKIKKGTEIRA